MTRPGSALATLSMLGLALLLASDAAAQARGRLVSGTLDGAYRDTFECRLVNRDLNDIDATLLLFSELGVVLASAPTTTLSPNQTLSVVATVWAYPGQSLRCEAQVSPNDSFAVGNLTVRAHGTSRTEASTPLQPDLVFSITEAAERSAVTADNVSIDQLAGDGTGPPVRCLTSNSGVMRVYLNLDATGSVIMEFEDNNGSFVDRVQGPGVVAFSYRTAQGLRQGRLTLTPDEGVVGIMSVETSALSTPSCFVVSP